MLNITTLLLFALLTSISLVGCKPYQKQVCSGDKIANSHWNSGTNIIKKALDPAIISTDSSVAHHGYAGSCSFSCDLGSFFDAASNSCLSDVVTFSPIYSIASNCTATNICDGIGTQNRLIDSCQKIVNGVNVDGGILSDCSGFAIPANLILSCSSPGGDITGIMIPGGTKTVSCLSGSSVQTFVSVSCDVGFHPNGQNCDVDILANDPFTKLLLHFDNSLGDSSVNSYTANTGFTPTYTLGRFGQGLSGSTITNINFLNFNNNVANFSTTGGDFTVELFAKFTSTTTNQTLFSKAGFTLEYEISVTQLGALTVGFSGANFSSSSNSALFDGNFHHIAFSYKNSGSYPVRLFIDGVNILSFNYNKAITPNLQNKFAIGQNAWPAIFGDTSFKGIIDDLRISDTLRETINGGVYTIAAPTTPMN